MATPSKCETCGDLGTVFVPWPSGYPHAVPCPECKPGVVCSVCVTSCPGRDVASILIRKLRAQLTAVTAKQNKALALLAQVDELLDYYTNSNRLEHPDLRQWIADYAALNEKTTP